MTLQYKNANEALLSLAHRVLTDGKEVDSRNGKTRELLMTQFTLTDPSAKEITVPGRKVSLPAQIAETMWILSGRNDVEWLSFYLPRAKDFSDDGQTWRGGYGPRIRQWKHKQDDTVYYTDQLAHVVNLLKEDSDTRRAVVTIYNPAIDNKPGKDIPCNNWVHFLPRDGVLHAHVAIRSNDLFWGWSGINAFEWTSLLEIVAGLTGLKRGSITFSISSLHLYEHHWGRAHSLLEQWQSHYDPAATPAGPAFRWDDELDTFDDLVKQWFQIEGQIRKGGLSTALLHQISTFPEPMFRSWLFVLLAYVHDDQTFVTKNYRGTSLALAAGLSPKRKDPSKVIGIQPLNNVRRDFTSFAGALHADKHKVYGTSWKRRGEMLGIMSNIARKVDRLGVAGGGDSSADTAIDMLMYLLKYNLWLAEKAANSTITGTRVNYTEGPEHATHVNVMLERLGAEAPDLKDLPNANLVQEITGLFDRLEEFVSEKRDGREQIVESLIQLTYPLAVRLWAKEEREAQNAKRQFSYETTAIEHVK